MQLRQRAAGRLEGLAVGVADPRHEIPVVAGQPGQPQRAARRRHVQAPTGVQCVREPEQVALIGPAPVMEDEQPPWLIGCAGRSRYVSEATGRP